MWARTDAGRITDCQFNRDEDKIIIIIAVEYTVWPEQYICIYLYIYFFLIKE